MQISTESVGKTIEGAKVKGAGNDLVLDTSSFYKPTQTGAYPIVLATYEIVCSKYPDAETGTAVKAFLQSTINGGQAGLADNGYIPIPDTFKSKLTTASTPSPDAREPTVPDPGAGVLVDAREPGSGPDRKVPAMAEVVTSGGVNSGLSTEAAGRRHRVRAARHRLGPG